MTNDHLTWFVFVESKIFSKQIGELPAGILTDIQLDLIQDPKRGNIVKGTHGVRRRELPTQARDEAKAVATGICIFTLNAPAEFTCYIYSAKVIKSSYHPTKRVIGALSQQIRRERES